MDYLHSQSRMDGRSRLQMGCSHSWVWTMDVGASGLTVEHTMVTAQSTSLPQSHSMCTWTSWIQQKISWIVPNRPFSPVLVLDAFGDIHTVSIPNPEFKRLCGGTSAELKVEIREDSGELLNNHSLPIAVTLEIQQVWVSMVQNPQKQN